ncbi:MAG: ABC transporter permease, partial [Bacteroidetes bacterium]|nr:ABC transporter permease [Bacteroidota bacterium]
WTGVARLVRGEMLRVSRMGYIEAARAQGIPPMIILLRHALPNAMPPVWVALAFGVGGAIIAESSLSFLHLIEYEVTWGNLLSAARSNLDAWWIGVFPGLAIFFTVLSFNILGERLRDLLDPRFNS